jgi:hypothetical protein
MGKGSEIACVFYDEKATTKAPSSSPVSTNRQQKQHKRSNFFKRICLSMSKDCERLPFVFEFTSENSQSQNLTKGPLSPHKTGPVKNLKQCLERCVDGPGPCESIVFDRANMFVLAYFLLNTNK